jgi:hypothetical protein
VLVAGKGSCEDRIAAVEGRCPEVARGGGGGGGGGGRLGAGRGKVRDRAGETCWMGKGDALAVRLVPSFFFSSHVTGRVLALLGPARRGRTSKR